MCLMKCTVWKSNVWEDVSWETGDIGKQGLHNVTNGCFFCHTVIWNIVMSQ